MTIIEFTDYQCPFCEQHFNETFPQIKEQYIDKGLVRYVVLDFPLVAIHPHAYEAAQVAECAGAQDKYWEMHDKLFGEQSKWASLGSATDVFKQFAADLGLDTAAFDSCLAKGDVNAEIDGDQQEGIRAGVQGTPAFIVGGVFVSGAQPFDVFKQIIDQQLGG